MFFVSWPESVIYQCTSVCAVPVTGYQYGSIFAVKHFQYLCTYTYISSNQACFPCQSDVGFFFKYGGPGGTKRNAKMHFLRKASIVNLFWFYVNLLLFEI